MADCSSKFTDDTTTFVKKRSKRKIRNESEKRRRDTFNRLIDELTLLVSKGDRKMDKSSVLKCAINFLKQQHLQPESTSGEASNMEALDSKLHATTGYNIPDIVQLYMDALGAGIFCIQCSGHIEHASTSAAALFDNTICELKGRIFFDFLDEASAKGFSEVLSTAVLHFAPTGTAIHSSVIQKSVTTKKSRRKLLINGYLKKILGNTDRSWVSNIAGENGTDNSTEVNEFFRFIGILVPLSNRLESEVTLGTISLWERQNVNFYIVYNTEFVCVDAKGCHLLGYSRFELLGTSGYDYIHMDDLLEVAECHKQLIKLGNYQIRPHRLQTKSHQWIWTDCMAIIENQISFQRVRCNYRVISMENVKKFKNEISLMKKSFNKIQPSFSRAITDTNSLQNHCRITTAINNTTNVCHLSSITSPSSISAVKNSSKSFSVADDCLSKQTNDSVSSSSIITTEKYSSSSSCIARIVTGPLPPKRIHPLPPKRIHKTESNKLPDSIPSTSFNCSTSFFQRSSNPLLSQSSDILPSRCCNQIPLAFIEHYPLPDSKLTVVEATNSNESHTNNVSNFTSYSTSVMTPAALSVSPVYQQVWEELQRRSELLRHQVLQKEMELRELHLKRFLASFHSNQS